MLFSAQIKIFFSLGACRWQENSANLMNEQNSLAEKKNI